MSRRECAVGGCVLDAVAHGLCRTHYRRQRAGRPLTDPEVGSPDGHGRYGILDEDGERALCHECGHWQAALGTHVATAHHMSARDYKLRHGLPLTKGLLASGARARRSEISRARLGTPAWQALETARDPGAAQAARTPQSWQARSQATRRDPSTATPNLPTRTVTVIICTVCGAAYCMLPGTGRPRTTCSPACAAARATTGRQNSARQRATANTERDALISAAVTAGTPVATVAATWGLTPTRIRQITKQPPTP